MKRIELLSLAILVAVLLGFSVVAMKLSQPDVPVDTGIGLESLKSGEFLAETVALAAACTTTGECHGVVTTTNALIGELAAVFVDLDANGILSATTDITLSYVSPLTTDMFLWSNLSTDIITYPMTTVVDRAGILISGGHVPHILTGKVRLQLGQTVSGTVGTMYIWYRRP